MNVYDFDNTIYRGDSTAGFVRYCLMKRPAAWRNVPRMLRYGFLYGIGAVSKMTFKANLYHMFSYIDDMEDLCDEFVRTHLNHIKDWYLDQWKTDDVIISASPYFLISRFCEQLNISHVMASPVEIDTGVCTGDNCHGKEKVRVFYERFPDGIIDEFYSDSLSDSPLAAIAKTAFLVHGNRRRPWPGQ